MKKLIIILAIIIIILMIGLYFVGNFLYNLAINPTSSKEMIFKDNRTEEERKAQQIQVENDTKWLEANASDVYITSQDNLKLHAYEMKNEKESNIWVIAIHGYTGSGDEMIEAAKHFQEKGYHVLAVDLRGHGKSQGDYIGMGWPDRLDIVNWIEYIIQKDQNSKIMLYGISMGAATTMMTTGEELPSNVKLAIEDCGYTSVWDEFADKLNVYFHLPTFPTLDVANLLTKIRAGYDFKEASAIEQVKKSKTPTLFIHGSEDKFVPFWMLDKVYEAANCPKEKLVIQGAQHANSSTTNPKLYWDTVDQFIEKYINQ